MTIWTPDVVKIRFVEAAATERFLPSIRTPKAFGYWPEFIYDQDDRDGWDQQAKDDHLALWQGRGAARADALTRYQECLSWTIEHIQEPKRRQLVWAFAFCRANKWDFGKLCEKNGWVKSTAYDRLLRTWKQLSLSFHNNGLLLREPSAFWIGHETPVMASITHTMAPRAENLAIKFSRGYRTEKSRDLIRTPEDAEAFAKLLHKHNTKVRRLQRAREERLLERIEAA